MTDHNDMTEEQIVKRVETLRSQNSAHMERLERMGARFNWLHAMVEHHFEFLTKCGVIPQAQFGKMLLSWEEHLKDQLTQGEEMMQLQIANARAAERAKQSGLVLPPGSSLKRG